VTISCGTTQIRGFITRGKLKTERRDGDYHPRRLGGAINWITIKLSRIQKLTRGGGFFKLAAPAHLLQRIYCTFTQSNLFSKWIALNALLRDINAGNGFLESLHFMD
jgi:hypothetical protein